MAKMIMNWPPFMIRLALWCYRRGQSYRSDRCACIPIRSASVTWNW
jgi:hypothetical protein